MTRDDFTATELACQTETSHEVFLADERADADARDRVSRHSDHLSDFAPLTPALPLLPAPRARGEASDGHTRRDTAARVRFPSGHGPHNLAVVGAAARGRAAVTVVAHHGIHTAGWIAIGVWLVGGFALGLAAGVWERRSGEADGGLILLAVWVNAPVVAAFGVLAGFALLAGWIVERTDDAVTVARPSRDDLQQRIADLERDLDLTA